MIRRRLPPNRWRGFRTRQTFSDERIWYDANAAAGRIILGATAVSGVLSAILFFVLPADAAVVFSIGVMVVALGVAVLLSFSALRRIAPQE